VNKEIEKTANLILQDVLLNKEQITGLCSTSMDCYDDLLYWANKIRVKNFGNKIKICSIVPGRLGGCNQDCKFCAQSARYDSGFAKPEILTDEQILAAAKETKEKSVPTFGIVYSGRSVSETELKRIGQLIRKITSDYQLGMCASLGIISKGQARRLADAGLKRYNHNLETSERHFPDIVTTHKYADRINTIKAAQSAGLGICAGGIFGIGETEDDRVDMALELRDLGVDTIPMNFLHPIKGTPLGDQKTLRPKQILRINAIYRFILPKVNLKIAGGRALNLGDMQSWIFYAGATSILSGNYLTTAGRSVYEDMRMLGDLGLESG